MINSTQMTGSKTNARDGAAETDHGQRGSHRLIRSRRRARGLRLIALVPGVAVAAMTCTPPSPHEKIAAAAQAATAPSLGTTQSFAVLAGSTVTNTGSTVVTGNLGVWPGAAATGFPPGLVAGGTIESATAVALQAQSDTTTAYDALEGESCDQDLTGQDLGGLTLTAGTYCFSSSAQLTGTLTLDAEGDPAAVFIFQIGSTLTTASKSEVAMINGGNLCNAYWQVGSSATLGTSTKFIGSILALESITLTTGASVLGRALARNAAVTMDTNTVSASSCQGLGGGGAGGASSSAASGATSNASSSAASNASSSAASGGGGAGAGGGGGGGACDGTTCCGKCVDVATDPLNCGACDHVCAPQESCIAGICCP